MSEVFTYFENPEMMKVYIPLITGVIVFVLTSFYNQWKERRTDVRLNDAYFRFKVVRRNIGNIPIFDKEENKHTLLICDIFEELERKKDENLRVKFAMIENTSENGIFNISIKHIFWDLAGKEVKKKYSQDFMLPNETFYLTFGDIGNDESIKYKNKGIKLNYETSAGVRYSIYQKRFNFKVIGYKGYRLKARIIFGGIPVIQKINLIPKESFTKSRPLKNKTD